MNIMCIIIKMSTLRASRNVDIETNCICGRKRVWIDLKNVESSV